MDDKKILNWIKWGTLLLALEIALVYFLAPPSRFASSITSKYFPYFLIPSLLIGVFMISIFILTFLQNDGSKKFLHHTFVEGKTVFIMILAIIGFLSLASAFFFITADTITYTIDTALHSDLKRFAVLGFFLPWEVLILFSITRKALRDKPKFWIGLPILLAGNYYLWHTLAEAGRYLQPFLPNVYPDETVHVFSTYTWWQLLLPIKEFAANWPFGLVLTYFLENLISTSGVWYLYQAILMLTAFFLSWKVFRSGTMAYVLALCLGFGTHLYHSFQYSGVAGFYLLQTLLLLLLYFSYEYIRRDEKNWPWLTALIPTLLLTAIYYEGWLDFLASTWLMAIFLFIYFKQKKQTQYSKRLGIVFGIFNAVAALYITIKLTYLPFAHASGESAIVLFYGREFLWRGVEDLISNYFTNLYMTVTNFLPPALVTSNALYQYGDYLAGRKALVYGHYVFYWRYLAGAATALFYVGFVKLIKRTIKDEPFSPYLPLVLFGMMTAVNGATHTIIQFLPMKAMPALGYYVEQGVLGFSLCIAYGLHLVNKNTRNKKVVYGVLGIVVVTILWSSIRRPNYLWHMLEVVGIDHQGPYPNPLNMLIIQIRNVLPGFLL